MLEYLDLERIKSLDLFGIEKLKETLKKLKIISSKNVSNINLISNLENLEWLILNNSAHLDSAIIVSGLSKIEALTISGSSYFLNGDLRSLKKLKETIKYYNVDNKKHYFYE
ncbi:MAG: hypothetical protein NE328_10375 [Lentisphaeraceae bacterium]|nr:hypothetical protein [Lentisphaeraceae bacterium]